MTANISESLDIRFPLIIPMMSDEINLEDLCGKLKIFILGSPALQAMLMPSNFEIGPVEMKSFYLTEMNLLDSPQLKSGS
jgi:hypothetical protein